MLDLNGVIINVHVFSLNDFPTVTPASVILMNMGNLTNYNPFKLHNPEYAVLDFSVESVGFGGVEIHPKGYGTYLIDLKTFESSLSQTILLGAGTKGKRSSLRFSKVMLHQVSTGASGNLQDIRISIAEGEKYNEILFGLLGKYTDKKPSVVLEDTKRDLWMTAEEAKAYGIIDNIVTNKLSKKK